jgi:hypothetical protein
MLKSALQWWTEKYIHVMQKLYGKKGLQTVKLNRNGIKLIQTGTTHKSSSACFIYRLLACFQDRLSIFTSDVRRFLLHKICFERLANPASVSHSFVG